MPSSIPLADRLNDPSLLVEAAYVGGVWQQAETRAQFEVRNPSTQAVIATVPDLGREETNRAVDIAFEVQPAWAAWTGKERGSVLRLLYDLIVGNADDLAAILTSEMGKPLSEARDEVLYGASYIEWFAEEAKRTYGDIIPSNRRDSRVLVIKQPVGVVGAITPWNFPNAMIARKLAPALAAGCTMVAKPAPQTPLSMLALALLVERAGVPKGVFSVVPSTRSSEVGTALATNNKVRKLTFTGSTEVGRTIMQQAAGQIKRVSLELGGNAPLIVFDDADLNQAIEGAMSAKYRNNGQTCVCANRIFVQSRIYESFVAKFAARVADLKIGDGFEQEVHLGPLIDRPALTKVEEHVADAVAKGASVLVGGGCAAPDGLFYKPTVLVNASASMKLATEETFGPVAAIFRFESEQDVVKLANATDYGLAAYFFARDLGRVMRVAEALQYGMVGVNTGVISTEVAPFGGLKHSGLGREGSKYGIEEYLDIKYINVQSSQLD